MIAPRHESGRPPGRRTIRGSFGAAMVAAACVAACAEDQPQIPPPPAFTPPTFTPPKVNAPKVPPLRPPTMLPPSSSSPSAPPPAKSGLAKPIPRRPTPIVMVNACGCPTIVPVATSENPAKGRVSGELTLRDLELFLSDREARYGGDWDKAMNDLAHEIDPDGSRHIATGPAPPPARPDLAVHEGGLSYRLLNGVPYSAAIRAGRLPRVVLLDSDQGAVLMNRIVRTLARINVYGEPEFGLRKALLAAARFVAHDLARAPHPIGTTAVSDTIAWERAAVSQGVLDGGMLEQARAAAVEVTLHSERLFLNNTIELALPRGDAKRAETDARSLDPFSGGDRAAGKEPASLGLDTIDLVNAALDVLMTTDRQGRPVSLLPYHGGPRGGVNTEFIYPLAAVAARRTVFDGPDFDDSPEGAVACKAFAVLVALLDHRRDDSRHWREGVWSQFFTQSLTPSGLVPAQRPLALVQRAALILGGTDDPDVAKAEADALAGLGDNWASRNDPGLRSVVPMINATTRDFAGFMAGSARVVFDTEVQRMWAYHRARAEVGEDPRIAIQLWDASRPDWIPVSAQLVCAPPAGAPRFVIVAKGVVHDFVVDKIYLGVPTTIQVLFDEPFDGDSYPVSVALGGRKVDLSATPVDADRRVFETEHFVASQ